MGRCLGADLLEGAALVFLGSKRRGGRADGLANISLLGLYISACDQVSA